MKLDKAHVGAVILAGGLARRMGGQDKGLVMLAGRPMASYALATISPLVGQCVINANRNTEVYARLVSAPGLVIADSMSGHLGPLAGLSAAIDCLDTRYILMCPCDSPFLQAGLVRELMHEIHKHDADIAVAHDGERLQPVFCIVNRRIKSSLDSFLDSGERKIDRWFLNHFLREVDARRYVDSFRNINTEEELAIAEKELAGD
ncbi:MAG: molybdenum cofactor guanylyltransferase MobA [Granulosicoccus sp.]